MTPAEIALARHHSYALLGRLFLDGLQPALLPFVRQIPVLAATLPEPWDADEAAALHQHLWGFNVFPYESVFLDDSGRLGGAATEQVQAQYRHAGFAIAPAATSADHIGGELRFLGFLCGAEADAWEDGLAPTARAMQQRQQKFLERHLLRWLLPLRLAVRRQGQPFYGALMELALEVVQGHGEALSLAAAAWALPPEPVLLTDERTGLREIAVYLVTPVHSGLFLSRDDIAALARAHELPRGFGSRQQMLVNLLRAAAQYDALPALLASLGALFAQERDALKTWAAQPVLAPFAVPWQARLAASIGLLTHLQARVEKFLDE